MKPKWNETSLLSARHELQCDKSIEVEFDLLV